MTAAQRERRSDSGAVLMELQWRTNQTMKTKLLASQ